jgi:hypothetical protein
MQLKYKTNFIFQKVDVFDESEPEEMIIGADTVTPIQESVAVAEEESELESAPEPELVADDQVAEDPVAEEPAVEEPVAEAPTTEELVAEEPATQPTQEQPANFDD